MCLPRKWRDVILVYAVLGSFGGYQVCHERWVDLILKADEWTHEVKHLPRVQVVPETVSAKDKDVAILYSGAVF